MELRMQSGSSLSNAHTDDTAMVLANLTCQRFRVRMKAASPRDASLQLYHCFTRRARGGSRLALTYINIYYTTPSTNVSQQQRGERCESGGRRW